MLMKYDFMVEDLEVTYFRDGLRHRAVGGVTLGFNRGEVTAVVGESGSGKTSIARALLGLIPHGGGSVYFRAASLPKRMGYIQQEAQASLHPLIPVGEQINDCAAARKRKHPKEVKEYTLNLLEELGLSPSRSFYRRYSNTLSGGQAQRVVLARALAMEAELLVADEATSQLDLVTQAGVVKLIYRLTKTRGLSTCFITHDLGLVAEIATNVCVLYRGRIIEEGPPVRLWKKPKHSYTKRLLEGLKRREARL